jgi:hypothetical protein
MLIPASAPGSYRVLLLVNGVPYAAAVYRVVSRASLGVHVVLTASGQTLVVSGTRFLPRLRLMLVAYAMFAGQQPVRIGLVQTDPQGKFALTRPLPNLPAGQYVLSAWALSALSAQVADAVFEVYL